MKRFSNRQWIERLPQIWIERKCTPKLECQLFADQKLRATKLCLCKSPHFQPHILQSLSQTTSSAIECRTQEFSRPDIRPQHRSHHNSPVGERCEVVWENSAMNPLLQREKLGTLQRAIYTSIYHLYMDYIMAVQGNMG